MEITNFDKRDLKNLQRYLYVPFPQVHQYEELEGFDDHSVEDIESNGAFVEEEWIYGNTPDREGCSYDELSEWGAVFNEYFDVSPLMEDEFVQDARQAFIEEMESGNVSCIHEFVAKYGLDK